MSHEQLFLSEPPASPGVSLLPDDGHNLQEAYDAYQVFCENGSHRIAWRNLTLFLELYLQPYFRIDHYPRIIHSNAARIEYLASLDIARLGYLTKDVLWVLFRITGFIPNDEELQNVRAGLRTLVIAREYLLLLPQYDLQVLLADVTNELNKRTPLTSYRYGKSIADLSIQWSPNNGTDLGILNFVDVELTPDDASEVIKFKVKADLATRPTIYDIPRLLLRRALSVGSTSSKRQLGAIKPDDEDLIGSLDPDRVPLAYTEKLQSVSKHSKITTAAETPFHSLAPFPPEQKTRSKHGGTSSGVLKASRIDHTNSGLQNNRRDAYNPLEVILEDTDEDRVAWEESDEESDLSDADSVGTSQTLESLLDFYSRGYKSGNHSSISVRDLSTRASIDVGELSRPEFFESLSRAQTLFDDDSSITSSSRKSNQTTHSGHQSFVTARTRISRHRSGRVSKQSSIESFVSIETASSLSQDIMTGSAYRELLKEKDLIPLPAVETDWSGRGQHAEFEPEETNQIPLQVEKLLGQTRNAIVESVRCRRVRLVRKTMRCTKWTGLKREDALYEVQHLYRVQHSHIVRLVGTYVMGNDLAILTYPCADYNLEQFMELARTAKDGSERSKSLRQFFTCVAKVLDFMHSFPLKHMDIKPQNLLVRDIRNCSINDTSPYKIYFTDFGISRTYESIEACETETPTAFTRAYAALEVVLQESRGLPADIFSLGCVYAEMLATILDELPTGRDSPTRKASSYWDALRSARQNSDSGLRPYHAANEDVRSWLLTLPLHEPELQAARSWIVQMLDNDPNKRPIARQIADDPHLPFACLSCTLRTGPEDFEAAEPQLTPLHESPPSVQTIVEVPNPP